MFRSLVPLIVVLALVVAPTTWAPFDAAAGTPTCGGLPATIVGRPPDSTTITGTDGDDVIVGTGQHEYIYGKRGNDRICGLGGPDVIYPGYGNDVAWGGYGHDTITDIQCGECVYPPGNDRLLGEVGNDSLFAGTGTDVCSGGPGADTLAPNAGCETVRSVESGLP